MDLLTQVKAHKYEQKSYKPGDFLIDEGLPGSKVYVLNEGEVSIEIDGTEIAKVDKPGSVFGEMSAIMGRSANATVKVSTNSDFYIIDDLLTAIRQDPEIAITILRGMVNRVEVMNRQQLERNWWQYLFSSK